MLPAGETQLCLARVWRHIAESPDSWAAEGCVCKWWRVDLQTKVIILPGEDPSFGRPVSRRSTAIQGFWILGRHHDFFFKTIWAIQVPSLTSASVWLAGIDLLPPPPPSLSELKSRLLEDSVRGWGKACCHPGCFGSFNKHVPAAYVDFDLNLLATSLSSLPDEK